MHLQVCRGHGLIQGRITFSLIETLVFFPAVVYYWPSSVCCKILICDTVEWNFSHVTVYHSKRGLKRNFIPFSLPVVSLFTIILWRSNICYTKILEFRDQGGGRPMDRSFVWYPQKKYLEDFKQQIIECLIATFPEEKLWLFCLSST